MISTGLLWYDDDAQRPIALKIAEAAERYRERVGLEPTTCELSPAQTALATAAKEPPARRTRKALAIPAISLRLEANDHLKPNYFLVGVAEGEVPRAVRGWAALEAEPERLPTRRAARVERVTAAKKAAPVKVASLAEVPALPSEAKPAPIKPTGRDRRKVAGAEPAARRPARAATEAQAEQPPKPRRVRQPEAAARQPQAATETHRVRRAANSTPATPPIQPSAETLRPAARKAGRRPAERDTQPAARTRKRAAPAAAGVTAPEPAAPKTTRRVNATPAVKTPARAAEPRTPAVMTSVASPAPEAPAKVNKATHAKGKTPPAAEAPKAAARAARAAKPATAATAMPVPSALPAARRTTAKKTDAVVPAKPAAQTRAGRAAKGTTSPDKSAAQAARTPRTVQLETPAPTTPVKASKRSDKRTAQPENAPVALRGKKAPVAASQPQAPVPARRSPRSALPEASPAKRSAPVAGIAAPPAAAGRARRARRVAAEGHLQARLWDESAAPVESTASRRKRSA